LRMIAEAWIFNSRTPISDIVTSKAVCGSFCDYIIHHFMKGNCNLGITLFHLLQLLGR
jgi:hypothetical protein